MLYGFCYILAPLDEIKNLLKGAEKKIDEKISDFTNKIK